MGVITEFSGVTMNRETAREQGGQGAKGVPGEVGVIIEHSGATMDQGTKVARGDRETGGRLVLDKSAGGLEARRLGTMGRRCTRPEGSRLERTRGGNREKGK